MVAKWKKQAIDGLADIFSRGGGQTRGGSDEARIKELHAKIGELTVERFFFGQGLWSLGHGRTVEMIESNHPRLSILK